MPSGIVPQFERRNDVSRIIHFVRAFALFLVGLLVTSLLTVVPATASSTSTQTNVRLASSDFTFYVRGTEVPFPFMDLVVKPMDQIFLGAFGPGVSVPYPASVGWMGVIAGGFLRGEFHYPTAQESIRQGHEALNGYIKDVRAADPTATISVVSLSQGSIVTSASALALQAEGFDTTGVRFVAAGNPTRANGGMAARLPFHFEIPGLFSAGGDDITSNPPPTDGAEYVLVTNQYDPFADVPLYLANPIALANWALSFVVGGVNAPFFVGFGPHAYDYTGLDPENPAATPGAIVKSYGNQTDVLLPAPVGYLPITALFRGIVPQSLIDAVDPFLRSIIETAYDRDRNADQRSTFQLVPPKSRWQSDAQSVAAGFDQMVGNFKEILDPAPSLPSKSVPESIPSPIQVMDDTTSVDTVLPPTQATAQGDTDTIEEVRTDDEVTPEVESTDVTDSSGDIQSDDPIASSRSVSEPESPPSPIQATTDDDEATEETPTQEDEVESVEVSTDSLEADGVQDENDSDSLPQSISESEDPAPSRESTDDNDTGDAASSQSESNRSDSAKDGTATAS